MRMRALRSLVVASVSVIGCLVIISTLTNTTPASPAALHTFVTHTHNHLNNLHNNLREEFESLVSAPDPDLLRRLGFVETPILYPHTNWTNLTTPVIATAIQSSEIGEAEAIIVTASTICPSATILLYTLDLTNKQIEKLETLCNDTCSLVTFDYATYPSHVRNWQLRAYRPIIIQELLVRAGAVLWLDPSIRMVNPFAKYDATNISIYQDSSDDFFFSGSQQNRIDGERIASFYLNGHEKNFLKKMKHVVPNNGNLENGFDTAEGFNSSLNAIFPLDDAYLLNLGSVEFSGVKEDNLRDNKSRVKSTSLWNVNKPNIVIRKRKHADSHEIPETLLLHQKEKPTASEKVNFELDIKTNSSHISEHSGLKLLNKEYSVHNIGETDVIGPSLQTVSGIYQKDSFNSFDNNEDSSLFAANLFPDIGENSLLRKWSNEALEHSGLLAWPLSDPGMGRLPTAALTYSGTFAAMHTTKELYDFHQMSDPGALLLFNTLPVHEHLMKPWLACSLIHRCIQPIGAQDTGCRFDKKPLFRYSGCHFYDTSVFNVALGLMLGQDSAPHQPAPPPVFTRTPLQSPSLSSVNSTNSSPGWPATAIWLQQPQLSLIKERHKPRSRSQKSLEKIESLPEQEKLDEMPKNTNFRGVWRRKSTNSSVSTVEFVDASAFNLSSQVTRVVLKKNLEVGALDHVHNLNVPSKVKSLHKNFTYANNSAINSFVSLNTVSLFSVPNESFRNFSTMSRRRKRSEARPNRRRLVSKSFPLSSGNVLRNTLSIVE